jgi:hypothetical protein
MPLWKAWENNGQMSTATFKPTNPWKSKIQRSTSKLFGKKCSKYGSPFHIINWIFPSKFSMEEWYW